MMYNIAQQESQNPVFMRLTDLFSNPGSGCGSGGTAGTFPAKSTT